jgi:hypothetical protein
MNDPIEYAKTFLVEHYWPGITAERFEAAAGQVRACAAQMEDEGTSVRFLHSTFVPEDEAALCVFQAPTAALVEEAYARAGVRFDRIVDALELVERHP